MRTVRVHGLSLFATRARLVTVEARFEAGDRGRTELVLSGLPDAVVRESRARLVSALEENRLPLTPGRLHLHLAPAGTRKAGEALDLPLAVAAAAALGYVRKARLGRALFLGELGIDGRLQDVPGGIAGAELAQSEGLSPLIGPPCTASEAALLSTTDVLAASDLSGVLSWISTGEGLSPPAPPPARPPHSKEASVGSALGILDALHGVGTAKRALEVAALGRHALLLFGPPGSGKSRLARGLLGLLPKPDRSEMLDLTRIASITGRWPGELVRTRPFRAPHHTSSFAGLVGGGVPPAPGEVTLAHAGVLFLDELGEFRRECLEALREPLEEERIRIARAGHSLDMPASFQLVAAMNPCPCGYRGHPRIPCRCAPYDIQRYRRRLSGPLLDRFDLCVEVPAIPAARLLEHPANEGDARAARARVLRARRRATKGGPNRRPFEANGRLRGEELERRTPLDKEARALLSRIAETQALSGRGVAALRRVARTIADLAGERRITAGHLAEARALRSPFEA